MLPEHDRFSTAAVHEIVERLERSQHVDRQTTRAFCDDFVDWVNSGVDAGEISEVDADRVRSDLLFAIGRLDYMDGKASDAMALFQASIDAADRSGHLQRQTLSLRALARVYEYAGMQTQSTQLMFEALELAERLGDARTKSRVMAGFASLYESQGAFEQTLDASFRAHELALESSDPVLIWSSYAYIGLAYSYLHRTDEALHWLERGLAEIDTDVAPELTLFCELYMMFALGRADRVGEALEIAERRLDDIEALPAQHAAATFVDVAELHLQRHDLDRAADMLARADRVAASEDLKGHRIRHSRIAADLHEAAGDSAEALRMMRLHAELGNELRGRNARLRLVAAERHFAGELAKKAQEIHQLRTVELEAKNEQLEVLNRQKDEILSVVAHDLRNPLAAMSMLSEMLLFDQAGSGDGELIEQLHAIRSASAEMGETIDQLLHLQRPNDPLLGVPLVDVIAKSLNWSIAHANERSVTVMDRIEPIEMEVDEALVRRALDDVLWIALQATNAGAVVGLTARPFDDGACVSVVVPGSLSEHAERTLYIARRLVERMGGSLRIAEKEMSTDIDIVLRSAANLRGADRQRDRANDSGASVRTIEG